MIDYDDEAARYDDTRGGSERADAAGAAIADLVASRGRCVDVAGGTGSVSLALSRAGWDVVVLDLSPGMLEVAAERLPGREAVADATRLPLADGSVDLVTTIWLLHLQPDLADAVIGEAARVLRPGGHWVTSVDKDRSHLRPPRSDADQTARVTRVADRVGMDPAGRAAFEGATIWRDADDPEVQIFRLAAFEKRA